MRFRSSATIVGVVLALVGTAFSATAGGSRPGLPPGQTQGITSNSIKVGGIAGIENPVNLPYGDIYVGAQAYFDMINAQGGVAGRKINFAVKRNDSSQPTRDLLQVRALNEEDKVFAIIPVAALYLTGADYTVQHGIPVFGYHVSNDWQKGPNLFGETGSTTCFTCVYPPHAWIARQLGATKVGVLGYNVQIAQDCTDWHVLSLHKYGIKTPYVNKALAFGFTISAFAADVEKIRKSGIQILTTCQDSNGSLLAKEAINQGGVNIPVVWGEGYSYDFLQRFGSKLDGLYLSLSEQPFEDPQPSVGLKQFMDAMAKGGHSLNKVALAGWENADLFVTGLKKVGRNLTRQKLIDAINTTTNWTAHGINSGVNWKVDGHKIVKNGLDCSSYVKVENGKFVPVFGKPGHPFVCLKGNAKSLDDVIYK